VSLILDLVGIGNRQAAKQNGLALGIDELVSIDLDERKLFRLRIVARPAPKSFVPPGAISLALAGLLSVDALQAE